WSSDVCSSDLTATTTIDESVAMLNNATDKTPTAITNIEVILEPILSVRTPIIKDPTSTPIIYTPMTLPVSAASNPLSIKNCGMCIEKLAIDVTRKKKTTNA